jgi:hypothetical protein
MLQKKKHKKTLQFFAVYFIDFLVQILVVLLSPFQLIDSAGMIWLNPVKHLGVGYSTTEMFGKLNVYS